MDSSPTIGLHATGVEASRIGEGFPGQRMVVLPRPRVRLALESPGTSALVVSDVGYFPHADHHGRERSHPVPQAIVMICARGRGWITWDGRREEVGPGQFVVIAPQVAHVYGADDDDPWTLWWLHVDGALVSQWCDLSGFRGTVSVRTLVDVGEAIGLVQQILSRLRTDAAPANILAAAGAAWHLLTLLEVKHVRMDSTEGAIEAVAAYLRAHYADSLTVTQLASMAQLSVSHFAALFRRQIGESVLAYRTQLRMARARELLDGTPLPVAEVARSVGYDDAFYFTRRFREVHGMSPRAYRADGKG